MGKETILFKRLEPAHLYALLPDDDYEVKNHFLLRERMKFHYRTSRTYKIDFTLIVARRKSCSKKEENLQKNHVVKRKNKLSMMQIVILTLKDNKLDTIVC